MTTRCEYCYHERECTTIQAAGLHGFVARAICAECERKYARPVRTTAPTTEKAGDV
jgi:hypothetical protein